jgi:hypothetical protein
MLRKYNNNGLVILYFIVHTLLGPLFLIRITTKNVLLVSNLHVQLMQVQNLNLYTLRKISMFQNNVVKNFAN